MAIDDLIKWYNIKRDSYAGGILVLPTGGGKTFTAIRFLCLQHYLMAIRFFGSLTRIISSNRHTAALESMLARLQNQNLN